MNKVLYLEQHGPNITQVFYYKNATEVLDKRCVDLLDEWCLKSGSSFEGRKKSFQYLTKGRQKPAILISERTQEIFFPLYGLNSEFNIWLSYLEIFACHQVEYNQTEIQFNDGTKIIVDINRRTIQNQLKRCRTFLDALNQVRHN